MDKNVEEQTVQATEKSEVKNTQEKNLLFGTIGYTDDTAYEKFISDHKDSFLELISTDWKPVVEIIFNKIRNKTQKPNQVIELEQFISIKGVKAIGNQLSSEKIKQINTLEAIEHKPPIEIPADEIEVVDEKIIKDEDIGQTALF